MNPRLLLKPMKEEDEWDSPHIVRYLEILSHEETEKIKELAKPRVRQECNVDLKAFGVFLHSYLVNSCVFLFFKLARATVRDPKTGVLTTANYRVSKRYHHLVATSVVYIEIS